MNRIVEESTGEMLYFVELTDRTEWYKDEALKVLHRADGPAVVRTSGSEGWYSHGQLHRLDGPAITEVDGYKEWYFQGQLHRLDGPAIIDIDGYKGWYHSDKLHRLDGPAQIKPDGSEEWWVNGKRHRVDGPARIGANGAIEWWQNGLRHRLDGPAIERKSGGLLQQFYLFGRIHSEKYVKQKYQLLVDSFGETTLKSLPFDVIEELIRNDFKEGHHK